MSDAFKDLLMVSEQPEQQMEFHLLCVPHYAITGEGNVVGEKTTRAFFGL